jgi:hypothetical protein
MPPGSATSPGHRRCEERQAQIGAARVARARSQKAVRDAEAVMRATAAARAARQSGEGVCRPATSAALTARQRKRLSASTSHNVAVVAPPPSRRYSSSQARTRRPTTTSAQQRSQTCGTRRAADQRADACSAPKQPVATATSLCSSEKLDAHIATTIDRAKAQQSARQRGRAAQRWLASEREAQALTHVTTADVAQRRRAVAKREALNTRATQRHRGAISTRATPTAAQSETEVAPAPAASAPSVSAGRLRQVPKVRCAIKSPAKQAGRTVARIHNQEAQQQKTMRRVGPPRRPVCSAPTLLLGDPMTE